MSDQHVVRPLPKHRTTQTQNKPIHTPNIHAPSGIRTHDPNIRASEDSTCIRPRCYYDWPTTLHVTILSRVGGLLDEMMGSSSDDWIY
jgi:hypothetical protein